MNGLEVHVLLDLSQRLFPGNFAQYRLIDHNHQQHSKKNTESIIKEQDPMTASGNI